MLLMHLWEKKMSKKKSQVALEYLVIVVIATILMMPAIQLFQSSSRDSANIANSNLISLLGRKLISESETVFYQGKHSRLGLSFNFPDNLNNITVRNKDQTYELIMDAVFEGLHTHIVYFSHVNLTFSNSSGGGPCEDVLPFPRKEFLVGGYKEVFVESCGDFVVIYLHDE